MTTVSRRPAWILITVVLVLLAGPPPAAAATFVKLEDECNGRQLMIKGPIEAGDYDRFVSSLARLVNERNLPAVQNPDVLWTVRLDSPGGDPREAMRIGRLLRRGLATTEVSYRFAPRPDGVWDFQRSGKLVCLDGEGRLSGCFQEMVEARCDGACLLVWLAGARRYAIEGALGVHGLAAVDAAELRGYLSDMGVGEAWRRRLLAPDPPGDGWLTWRERHDLGGRTAALDDLLAGCPPPLDRDESFRAAVAPPGAARDALNARASAHDACRLRRLARARSGLLARLQAVPAAPSEGSGR